MNYIGYSYKLDDEVSDSGLAHSRNDNVVNLIGRIICENRRVLFLYMEHETDQPNLIEPTEQSTIAGAFELCLVVRGGVSDSGVGKGVGGRGGTPLIMIFINDYETFSVNSDDSAD